MRFLSLYFTIGISHSLSGDTKRGFLFCVKTVRQTREEEWPVRLTVQRSKGWEFTNEMHGHYAKL